MGLTAGELAKTDNLVTAGPEDSLASAINKINSSHDAVFVTQKNQLLGVISAYQVLYRRHYPGSTKVKNCLFLAPKLKPETKIDQIARLMLESKLYFLPVVTASGKWLGVVSFRRLLRQLQGVSAKPKPLSMAPDNLTVGQARNLMKSTGHSRIIIVTPSGRLSGIVTRSDLGKTLDLAPSTPVKRFIKRDVTTCRQNDNLTIAVNQMLDKNIGSIVMVNQNFQPIGLLSIRDCLQELTRMPWGLKAPLKVRLEKVRSGFEAFVGRGKIVASATGRFKKQTIREALNKLKRRLRK